MCTQADLALCAAVSKFDNQANVHLSKNDRRASYRKYEDLVVDGYARYPGENYPVSMEYRRDGMARITVEMVAEKLELALTNCVRQASAWSRRQA